MQLIQLLIDGIASGCIYGLVALGFVLIYKATETINFAQGDILMLGAFVAYSLIGILGMDYLTGFALTVLIIAVFGFFLDAVVVRQIIGQPAFATVMLTIGLGFIFRGFASIFWGTDIYSFSTPFSGKILQTGGLVISYVNISIIVGTALLMIILYSFFSFSKIGVAMRASSENQLAAYYVGIPVKFIPFDSFAKMNRALDTGHIDMSYSKGPEYAYAKIIYKTVCWLKILIKFVVF